jgi:diketogulonate reductase-like aldo/keto reductase
VPALGLGTGQLTGEVCYAAVRCALDLGYRHVDTARAYHNEDSVGRAIRDSRLARADIFVTSKVWRSDIAADRVATSVEESLRQLDTDYVDLLLAHWPVEDVPLGETMTALRRVQESGRARHVGTSNFTPRQVREAAEHAPVFCNQVEYHPLLAQDEVLAVAGELDHLVTAYSPIAQGAVAADAVIGRIAAAHARTPAQVALRWLVQQPRVAAIPRSSRPERLAANLSVFDFTLSDSEMKEISERARRRRERLSDPEFAPDWSDGRATRTGTEDREVQAQ